MLVVVYILVLFISRSQIKVRLKIFGRKYDLKMKKKKKWQLRSISSRKAKFIEVFFLDQKYCKHLLGKSYRTTEEGLTVTV